MSELATQNERVLRHLTEHGEIDQGVTLRWSPPITRLAARVADLRAAGHPVDAIGKAGKFARYALVGERPRPPAGPVCPRCEAPVDDLRPTLSPDVKAARCPTHRTVMVRVPRS